MTQEKNDAALIEAVTERVTELEIKLGFTEDLVEELNRTVYRQQEELDRLREAIRSLHQQVQTAAVAVEPTSLRDEIPPHY